MNEPNIETSFRAGWRGALSRLAPPTVIVALSALSFVANAASPSRGAEVYFKHCSECHGEDGAGAMPGMPNFKRGDGLMKPDRALAESVRMGKLAMPAFQGLLRDEEIYDVISYLRTLR